MSVKWPSANMASSSWGCNYKRDVRSWGLLILGQIIIHSSRFTQVRNPIKHPLGMQVSAEVRTHVVCTRSMSVSGGSCFPHNCKTVLETSEFLQRLPQRWLRRVIGYGIDYCFGCECRLHLHCRRNPHKRLT